MDDSERLQRMKDNLYDTERYAIDYCDPKHFTIYGFCRNCNRRCECPLFDPKGLMSFLEYQDYKRRWNEQRSDLTLDAMRRAE